MSFQGVDMVGLADLLRQSEGKPDSDSDDETHGTVGGNRNFGPGHIGAMKKSIGQSGDGDKNAIPATQIWNQTEVSNEISKANIPALEDPRKTPKYEMYYRQSVTTEDVFLQMGNKTPSSASCENLVVEIYLPDEQDFTKIQLNLKAQAIDLRSPIHFLHLGLPHAIDTMAGHAKWDQDKEKLIVTVKIIRDTDGLNF